MRNNLIDLLRGIAFILMLIHHINYFNPLNNYSVSNNVNYCGTISRTLFILLVGISINLFKKKDESKISSKPYKILCSALLVTLATYLFLPTKNIIFFGVLHFISFVTILSQFIDFNTKNSLIIIIISLFMDNYMQSIKSNNNYFYVALGSYAQKLNPIDIFPVFKWMPYIAFGSILGSVLKDMEIDFDIKHLDLLKLIGKNSLLFYVLHIIPCIFWVSKKKINNFII